MKRLTARTPWLPFGVDRDANIRLLCLPHAGAGAISFHAWGKTLPRHIATCPVQPPGREHRKGEKPLTEVGPLVAELAPVVLAELNSPYAIFGHSTGAICAFELAREIRRLGGRAPVHLFVAGRPAPHLPLPRTQVALLSPDELAELLRRLGGTPEELLADDDFLASIQTLLAADFSLNQGYEYYAEPPLEIPITALGSTADNGASIADMAAWEAHTQAGFQLHVITGGHFAVLQRAAEVQAFIGEALCC